MQFVQIAKDYIQPPQSYSLRQFAANRNNQPKKKFPDAAYPILQDKAPKGKPKKWFLIFK
jgi:hypothetical protein